MLKPKPKYAAALLGVIILIMMALDHYILTTPNNELHARGHEDLDALITFVFPVISIPIVFIFTDRLRESGLENKWILRIIRYGILAYFYKVLLLLLLLLIMALLGMGITV